LGANNKYCRNKQGRLHVTVKNREKVKEESRLGEKSVAVRWCVVQN